MANKKLKINIDADTTEALKQMKEITEVANECVATLEKLDKVTGRLGKNIEQAPITITPSVLLNGKEIARNITRGTQV